MNKYKKLYEDIELTCLCTDTHEEAEEYLKPLRELIDHCEVLEKHYANQEDKAMFERLIWYEDVPLKSVRRDKLIRYIDMFFRSWCVCNEKYKDIADKLKAEKARSAALKDALTRACERIEYENTEGKMVNACECPKSIYAFTPGCCRKDVCRLSNTECWKEWFMHLSTQKNRN